MFRFLTHRLPHPAKGQFSVIHECADCGLFSGLIAALPGNDQCCPRCGKVLRRVRRRPLDRALAYTVAGLFFYMLTVSSPLLQVSIYGRERLSRLSTGPFALDDWGFWPVASLVFMTTMLFPLIKLVGQLVVLIGLRLQRQPRWLGTLFGWLKHIGPWTMVEVYLLGFIVAYTRLQVMSHVMLGPAVYGLVGLMLCVVGSDAILDPEAVWERIRRPRRREAVFAVGSEPLLIGCDTCHQVSRGRSGQNCPRCGEILHRRKPYSLRRTWALTIAAALCYLPSNLLPIMTITKLGNTQSYTIMGGMRELEKVGLYPLALLVFVASIMIPMFKLVSLLFLLLQTNARIESWLSARTRLYRVIDFIGRWSMVDIFMVSILVALVQFGRFAEVQPNAGAFYFASVVILTILAVEAFDPRLMWDAAGDPAPLVKVPPVTTPFASPAESPRA